MTADINEICQAIADRQGISPAEALASFKRDFLPRDQVLETITGSRGTVLDQLNTKDTSGDMVAISEQSKLECRRLELEQKKLDAEIRKQELAEKKIEAELKMAKDKLEMEEKWKERAEQRKEREETRKEDTRKEEMKLERERIREDSLYNKLLLQSNSGKEVYQHMIDSKDKEQDREISWKTELARIEAEHDTDLAKLNLSAKAETAEKMDDLISKMDHAGSKSPSASSFLEQMREYQKMQTDLMGITFDTLESRGFDTTAMKKAVNIAEKKPGGLETILELGKKVFTDYLKPAGENAIKELDAAKGIKSGLEGPNQNSLAIARQHEDDAFRKEQAALRQEEIRRQELAQMQQEDEARQKQQYQQLLTENADLERQKQRLKTQAAQHQALIAKTMELGIPTDPGMSDQQIYALVTGALETIREKAAELDIKIDGLSLEQIFDLIEQKEAAAEQERKDPEPEEKAVPESGKSIDATPEAPKPESEQSTTAPADPEPKKEQIVEVSEEPDPMWFARGGY